MYGIRFVQDFSCSLRRNSQQFFISQYVGCILVSSSAVDRFAIWAILHYLLLMMLLMIKSHSSLFCSRFTGRRWKQLSETLRRICMPNIVKGNFQSIQVDTQQCISCIFQTQVKILLKSLEWYIINQQQISILISNSNFTPVIHPVSIDQYINIF
ncbi:Hypothetical_protein [Hexamita inflata]|uniref:Hypothetical_protein n=1 Tax=Hexamita inflata TaxID=28002 RepID=A0AA86UFQ8_9EUKA|nr:Hypothetical protein HINF_LOCUS43995 [Hexamita inflata]CAI9966358.1 Hypothetical protein HINF_LOCUS54003 [Hexamita inflata]